MIQSFKKISSVCFFIAVTIYSTTSSGQDTSASMVPASGAYIGLGFDASSTQFNGQQVQATGISTVSPAGTTGSARGVRLYL